MREKCRESSKICAAKSFILSWHQRKHIYKSGITRWHLIGEVTEVDCNKKRVFSLCLHRFSLVFDAFVLYLPLFYTAFYTKCQNSGRSPTCRVNWSGLKNRIFQIEFFKNSKNDVPSVWENSKNVARVPDGWDLDLRIFLWRIFP